jgi:DNA-binding NtrC family response regulator
MPSQKQPNSQAILLVEADVIVRFALAEYLRACAFVVIEAADAQDAREVLLAGPSIDILFSDAQLAGDDNGFALAQWVRRYRPNIDVILTSSVINKAQAATTFCSHYPDQTAPSDANSLATRIHTMIAERKRRLRPPSTTAAWPRRRRRS